MKKILILAWLILCLPKFSEAQDSLNEFKKLIHDARENATGILKQKTVLESALASLTSKKLYWTPTGAVTISSAALEGSRTSTDRANTSLALNIFKFGANDAGKNAAAVQVQAEQSRLRTEQDDLELLVAKLLFQQIRQEKIIQIRRKSFELKTESFRVAGRRYQSGQLPSQELEKARIERESAKISLGEAELGKIQILQSLRSVQPDAQWKLNDWPYMMLAQKPKVISKKLGPQSKLVALQMDEQYYQNKASEVLRGQYLPSLDYLGSWDKTLTGAGANGQWTSTVTLTIPLWDQLAGKATASDLENRARSARLAAEQLKRDNELSVQNLNQRIELTQENLTSALSGVGRLQELRNDSLKRFQIGRATVNDLLLDETRYLDAETALLSSLVSFHELLVEACQLAGESLTACY